VEVKEVILGISKRAERELGEIGFDFFIRPFIEEHEDGVTVVFTFGRDYDQVFCLINNYSRKELEDTETVVRRLCSGIYDSYIRTAITTYAVELEKEIKCRCGNSSRIFYYQSIPERREKIVESIWKEDWKNIPIGVGCPKCFHEILLGKHLLRLL